MRKLLVAFLVAAASLAVSASLRAQSYTTISPSQCVWLEGDQLSWAAPDFNDSGWQPLMQGKMPDAPHFWIRCHADLGALNRIAKSAIQVRLYAAYELYANGRLLGGAGSLRSGNFSMNSIRSYSVTSTDLPPGPSVLALRVTQNVTVTNSGPLLGLIESGMDLRAGDRFVLDSLRSEAVLARSSRYLANAICFGIIGVIAVMLLGLYLSDRSRPELLLLSLTCLSVTLLRLNEFGVASLMNFSIRDSLASVALGNVTHVLTEIPFFYALARRRLPLLVRALLIVSVLAFMPSVISLFRSPGEWAWLEPFNRLAVRPSAMALNIALSLVPFLAFWPYSQIERRVRPLAFLCMLWGIADFVWFAVEMTGIQLAGLPNLFAIWGQTLLEFRAITTAGALVALLGLLFREQRQATEERAMLAGEIHAARNVQQYLIPEHLPATPGFSIQSEYRPAREVGGDFFQVLPQSADGSLLIVIGDVAGKGIEAGMLATLIVGAVRTAAGFTSDPARILALLNDRLQGRGLVTCLALRIEQDGSATLVNAGHLPPYLNGKELPIEGALPLGAVPGMQFPASHFSLNAGDTLLLLTDGLVEARNAAGELFGFERTAAMSTESAQNIARAAQAHGQEDDITLLTVSFTPALTLGAMPGSISAPAPVGSQRY
jgi:Stage II sporulation protein E (SpoIIE)